MLKNKNNLTKTQNLVINLSAFTTVPFVYAFGTNLSKKLESIPLYIGTVALSIATPIVIKKVSTKVLTKKKDKKKEIDNKEE